MFYVHVYGFGTFQGVRRKKKAHWEFLFPILAHHHESCSLVMLSRHALFAWVRLDVNKEKLNDLYYPSSSMSYFLLTFSSSCSVPTSGQTECKVTSALMLLQHPDWIIQGWWECCQHITTAEYFETSSKTCICDNWLMHSFYIELLSACLKYHLRIVLWCFGLRLYLHSGFLLFNDPISPLMFDSWINWTALMSLSLFCRY